MTTLRDTSVLVLGLGDSGLAMARWCASAGAGVQVWDSRSSPPQAEALRQELPQVVLRSGPLDATALQGVQRVLKSPGLSPHDERLAALLAAARATGVPVQGELDLFAQALLALKAERGYAPQVLAITGTNGKTTVTALCTLLVERAGRRVASAGNIGPTMLDTLAAALALEPASTEPPAPVFEHLPDVWVLELSSFQLDGVTGFDPSAAAVLNISQDHLDWHGSMEDYVRAKARIFGPSTVWVLNRDDVRVEGLVPAPTPVKAARGKPVRLQPPAMRVVRFGLDTPRAAGDFGLVVENGMAWLVRALEADETLQRGRSGTRQAQEIHLQRLMPADALRIRGRHNAANALAALALATSIGCPLAPMLHGLREYRGEPHRVAFVATVGEVDAYDDSKGTNVGATVAALLGLGADRAPARLAVILGGDGKGQDFTPLLEPVRRHARAVALIGRDGAAIGRVLAKADVPMQFHDTLEAATRWSFEQARPGDSVLLSPACASLDMFRHYGHRAEVFVAAVQALAAEQGVPS